MKSNKSLVAGEEIFAYSYIEVKGILTLMQQNSLCEPLQ